MGSGCSSPLRRLGGKRGKPRQDSSVFEAANGDNSGNQTQEKPQSSRQQHQLQTQQQSHQHQKLLLDNEITVHSEINEDHPSSASYYTDTRGHNDETKISDTTGVLETKSCSTNATQQTSCANQVTSNAGLVARMKGVNGTYAPHDRHLLVSPALSPAPSTCYSPLPAASVGTGCQTPLDLVDLNEAFKTLTFGPPECYNNNSNNNNLTSKRIKQPERHQSDLLNNYHTQQLFHLQDDLINYITVVFTSTENFQLISQNSEESQSLSTKQSTTNVNTLSDLEAISSHIETNLKSFCDEHLFKMRFLNLSHAHLSKYFHINNLLDVSMRIFEQEYQRNSQQMIVIVLSNNNNPSSLDVSSSSGNANTNTDSGKQYHTLDKRQLPSKIEAQLMNKLLLSNLGNAREILKRWYNQVGNTFYLNPIYLVYPNLLNGTKKDRDDAWQRWCEDSSELIRFIELFVESNREVSSQLKLKSLFSSQMEFILKEPSLQKRTLLIRNNLPSAMPLNQQQSLQQQQSGTKESYKYGTLADLARLLADPNKLTLKRFMQNDEFVKTIGNWVSDNFNKFVESIVESKIMYGKHIPSFIERNLFIELTSQRHRLEYYLDKVTESFETKSKTFFTSHIFPILDSVINSTTVTQDSSSPCPLPANEDSGKLSPELQTTTNHLVFISGPKGCGKSTLFAQIIKLAVQELLNKAQIIYRFCGSTLDSMSSNRVLRSICEQFCQTQGENITAASYIYSARAEIMNALNKIIKMQTCLIFLDGLDVINQLSESDFDWLCEIKAVPKVKIFIMLETDSALYKKALKFYSDATYISLDNPTTSEWAQMLTSTARSKRFSSVGDLYDELKKIGGSEANKDVGLSYRDVNNIINMCRVRQLNNEAIYPELTIQVMKNNMTTTSNLGNIFRSLLSHMNYLMNSYQLSSLIAVFYSSRIGVSETDLINIMTLISSSDKNNFGPVSGVFSSTLWTYVKIQLEPWLNYIICDKSIKISLDRDFLDVAVKTYLPSTYPNILADVQEILLDYYSRPSRSALKLSSSQPAGGSLELREFVSSSERSWLATRASETFNLLLQTNPAKARELILSKQQFFLQFLYSRWPEEFIEDFNRLRDTSGGRKSSSATSSDELLQCLLNFVKQCIYPLRYDGAQIYSQIYCRAFETSKVGKLSKNKKYAEILNVASCPPIYNLLPISEASVNSFIKTRIGQTHISSNSNGGNDQVANASSSSTATLSAQTVIAGGSTGSQKVASRTSSYSNSQQTTINQQQQSGSSYQQQVKQKIYTIKDNHRHIIAIYPDKGSLCVWDIYEEKSVRTISNLDQPRDLKMIDQKRAVILCNRELRVYDLDSGLMLVKLKGVMNQKMPFFEVFGENYVVALARNRMYVNMLNLNTGELETTFKVGEDRFLNSLLVSANGGICVCGDETQKPFPLLVWNLNERRLLYDLRLERHEFITRMSAISDDGYFVVSVCRQLSDTENSTGTITSMSSSATATTNNKSSSPNFIVIYDLRSGTLFKKWKPGLDSCAVAISLSANRSGKVINTIVDSSILVWDLATGSKRHTLIGHSAPADVMKVQNNRLFSMDSTCQDQSLRIWDIEEGYCLAVFSPDAPVSCCQISIRGDALICGFAAETRLSTLALCKNETVSDVCKRNKRRKSSKSIYVFDEPPARKASS